MQEDAALGAIGRSGVAIRPLARLLQIRISDVRCKTVNQQSLETTMSATVNLGDSDLVDKDKETLIRQCVDHDRKSQEQLYLRHADRVYRLMYRMVGPEHADDLTQQVFLCVFRRIAQYAGRSSFATWLFRLATNEALQFLRRERLRSSVRILHDPADVRARTQKTIDDREALNDALSKLDPDLRCVFLLREQEKMSYQDLALALDIAEGTVASRLNRARHELRRLLSYQR